MYRHPKLPATQSLAVLTVELGSAAPTEVRLLPTGRFAATDGSGRPDQPGFWLLDDRAASALVAQAAGRQSDYVIDYEHQTLSGQQAPAAGWFGALEHRDDGLYATGVRWTKRAAALIADGEYRYLSPVFAWDRVSGRVERLYHAGLTNNPGLDGLTDLAALTALTTNPLEEPAVDLSQLIAKLGLPADTTEDQALAAVTALKAKAAEAETQIAALKSAAPDLTKYAPLAVVEELKGQLATLTAKGASTELDALIDEAKRGGKLIPAQESWARELGAKDPAALKSYLAATPAIAALGGTQTGGKSPVSGGGKPPIDDSELAICKTLGLATEAYLKAKEAP